MKSIRHLIGTIVLILWLLGVLDIIDFRLCIGPMGACNAPPAPFLQKAT
ncbi:MAG: hypothetical protein K2X78_02840 [Burkholderiaceae bacterium]|nr:hypothetical protein [Burkholderiaceae bacterium]